MYKKYNDILEEVERLRETDKKLKKNQPNLSLFSYFKEVIEELEKKGKIGYANVFTSTKNSFKTFLKGRDINFNELNLSFLLKYEEFLNEKGNSLNTQFVFLRTLKTLVNYAVKEELIASCQGCCRAKLT